MASKSVLPSLAPVPVFSTSEKPIHSRSYDLQLKRGSVTVQEVKDLVALLKVHSHGR